MYPNIFAILVVLLVLMTSNGRTSADCYSTGNTWSDIGDDEDINVAFILLCDHLSGHFDTNGTVTIEDCANVGNNRVDASITILETENSTFTSHFDLYQEVCKILLDKASLTVKTDCNKRGGVMNEFAELGPEFGKYGFINGDVKADPNRGKCRKTAKRHVKFG